MPKERKGRPHAKGEHAERQRRLVELLELLNAKCRSVSVILKPLLLSESIQCIQNARVVRAIGRCRCR